LKKFHIWSEQESLTHTLYSLEPHQRIVVYAAEEQTINDEFDPHQMSEQKSVDFLFGSTWYDLFSKKKYNSKVNVHFWSNFWLYKTVAKIDLVNLNKPLNERLFISLNNRAHLHRCKMVDFLCKEKLLKKDGIISWHHRDSEVDMYKFRYWEPKKLTLSDNFSKRQDQHCLPIEFNKAFLNLIVESTVEGIFVTEKTYHAILAQKPFVCLAAPRFHKFLKNQGFEMFEDIINYEFDDEPNLDKRIMMIIYELKQLKKQNYNQLYRKIKPKLEYNKQKALQIVRSQEGVPRIARGFKYYTDLIEAAKCRSDL